MGASVGAAARQRSEVLWVSEGRSAATRRRAETAGLVDAGNVGAIVEQCDVLVSVCPPHAAVGQARTIVAHGFAGIYVDANAVAPPTSLEISDIVEAEGASYVDASLIGPPVLRSETTRLYLAGAQSDHVAELFRGSALEPIVLSAGPPAASTLKMCYAAYTKGTAALLMSIRALARHQAVEAALLGEWEHSQPELGRRSEVIAVRSAAKAWRFAGEMEEIAATFAGAGLPRGFHDAAGEIYRALADFKDVPEAELDGVLERLLRAGAGSSSG